MWGPLVIVSIWGERREVRETVPSILITSFIELDVDYMPSLSAPLSVSPVHTDKRE
jgi:hypothetical protein